MEITVNVDDFVSKDEIKDEVRFAVAGMVSRSVREWFGSAEARVIVEQTARDIVENEMQKRGIDMQKEISDAFLRELEKMPYYSIFTEREMFGKVVKSQAQKTLDEIVAELKPEMIEYVREKFLAGIDAEDGASVISDCFYTMMLNAIKGE